MHRIFSLILAFSLTGVAACAQDAQSHVPASGTKAVPSELTATGVAPNDVVISIQGFCDQGLLVEGTVSAAGEKREGGDGSKGAITKLNGDATAGGDNKTTDCKTEVTRAQFERLVDSLEPKMRRSDRIRVAVRYAEGLIFAQKAHELGIEKDPKFEERAKYSYLQTLSASFNKYLTLKGLDVSDSEVETYYREHPELFVQGHFERIFVPNLRKHSDVPSTPEGVYKMRAADEAAMKSLAERVRARAIAGASFGRLQAEVYKFAGQDKADTPDVDLDEVNRTEAPAELQQVFDLKPGQISEVISASKGWHIVKMISLKTIPLSEAKGTLQRIRILELTNAAKNSARTEFNDAYFNTLGGMEPAAVEQKEQK
jgi:hypothetical protein